MKNIYLVGFMATGKTSVGKELAKKLGKTFLDLDDLIEGKEGMCIKDIFAKKGEPYFREVEKMALVEVSKQKEIIVGCGGGAIVHKGNLDILKKTGITICLEANIDTIIKRSKSTDLRPLLNVDNPKEKAAELLSKRKESYDKADYKIDTNNLSVSQVVDKILEILEKDKTNE